MVPDLVNTSGGLETALPFERARLVRLCAKLTGDVDAAEDLAQETLFEAWRHAHKLRDQQGRAQWLSAIARNVCLRWSRGRELARLTRLDKDEDSAIPALEHQLQDEFDLEIELERHELAELLDRALALLPPATRAVLVQRYVEESPQAEVAARLGMSEGAVAMRLQRGKLQLRRLFATELREHAAPYGLAETVSDDWQETRIWCPHCGRRRLMGRFLRTIGSFTLRCPDCMPDYRSDRSANMGHAVSPELFRGVHGYKPALSRMMAHADDYYRRAFLRGTAPCSNCGHINQLGIDVPGTVPPSALARRGVYVQCDACHSLSDLCLEGLALWRPEGRRFWQRHPRIAALPERELDFEGRPAILASFQSVTEHARFDVIFARDTYKVLSVHGAPPEP
ncbi:MAG: RNA polymerase sigma factor [Chloroflexota bacterium]|nr:RNA polymerase sigma factor [Chloroflexota bacterium]